LIFIAFENSSGLFYGGSLIDAAFVM